MPVNFKKRSSGGLLDGNLNIDRLISSGNLSNDETLRLEKIREQWNFYEGFQWEDIDDEDSPQVTYNYCRPFVNKFVAFEFGNGFTLKTCEGLNEVSVTQGDSKVDTDPDVNKDGFVSQEDIKDGNNQIHTKERNAYEFLTQVWEDNNREEFCEELGQTKSVTGDAWVKIQYINKEDLNDPFEKYPKGRIRVTVLPTQYVYPEFNQHDIKECIGILIMYPIQRRENTGLLLRRTELKTIIYKEYWTKDEIVVYENDKEIDRMENPYKMLPFVHIKNRTIAGRTYGLSDLEDIIPLNTEFNMKKSDMSEVIDYHSAPITLVYGAKIGNLEKGANKVWGGLPKDGRVENLQMTGDLIASKTYTDDLKTSMCEIGSMPETTLGGASAISNTSGVALQYMNAPLIDATKSKRHCTKIGIETVNSIILFIALKEGLITKPAEVTMNEFLSNEVELPDTLPKDEIMELQAIQQELQLGLESRRGAMERLGKENIQEKIDEIDRERAEHPELFSGYGNNFQQINSGMTNGQTPVEEVRKEVTGENGAGSGQSIS